MPRWTCPECDRQFGRPGQGHECAPALTIEEYFETGPPHERPVFDAVHGHLAPLADVYVEPVSVGVFFKVNRVFAQLRPMTRWVACGFILPRVVAHDRIARKVIGEGDRWFHVVNVSMAAEVDETLTDWLTEAYLADHG